MVVEGLNSSIYYYIHIYIYIFKGKMGIINHSRFEPYLIIFQLVNGCFQAVRDQILPAQQQTKEELILLT